MQPNILTIVKLTKRYKIYVFAPLSNNQYGFMGIFGVSYQLIQPRIT